MRVCDVHQVSLASHQKTAELIIKTLESEGSIE